MGCSYIQQLYRQLENVSGNEPAVYAATPTSIVAPSSYDNVKANKVTAKQNQNQNKNSTPRYLFQVSERRMHWNR